MSAYRGNINFNLWWGSREKTAQKIYLETEKLKIAFSAARGSRMAPYDGNVTISTPEKLDDKQIFNVLSRIYPHKKVLKENNRFKLEF